MAKKVLISGGSRGIGKAIALRLAKSGYALSIYSRTQSELEEIKKLALIAGASTVNIYSGDITDTQRVDDWVKSESSDSKNSLWGCICSAGVYGPIGPLLENNWTEWKTGIEINLLGSAYLMKSFSTQLVQKNLKGSIILLSGGGATKGEPNTSCYNASKSALVRLGETLAVELEPYGISVNSIAPGAIKTSLHDVVLKAGPKLAGQKRYEAALKLMETGGASTETVSELVEYLLAEEHQMITGRLLSAVWDDWKNLDKNWDKIHPSDIYQLRRIVPEDRK